jgi:hypothetical protein
VVSLQSVVVARESQTSCELQGDTLILDFDKGAYFGLDAIGTLIWRHLQQPQTVKEICNAVVEQYEVDLATCEQDVVGLLERLYAEGLIELRSAPTI